MSELWLDVFDRWTTDPPEGPVDRALVHKRRDENVLVARLEQTGEGRFACQLRVPDDHPFFYEHPVDHVPGLALIEAGRQVGLAVAHAFYAVPAEGYTFVLGELNASFTSFAGRSQPLFGIARVTDVRLRQGVLQSMHFTGHYLQGGRSIGTLTGTWTILKTATLERLRRDV